MRLKISVIIPAFNEQSVIKNCVDSLLKQSEQDFEIIVINDGSTDKTLEILQELEKEVLHLKILEQNHKGPGAARNLGAQNAKGENLVFVDADMVFEKDFLKKLIEPIGKQGVIGTFSKEEYLLNKTNNWARFWNINLGRRPEKLHPDNYPDRQNVFRAIKKNEFDRVGGFETQIGYTDDWSLSRKLGKLAVNAPGAVFYHKNPENLYEVWKQARWFGKNEFLTRNFVRRIYSIIRYNILFSILKGIYYGLKIKDLRYILFKITYDSAVTTSVLLSFFKEQKNK